MTDERPKPGTKEFDEWMKARAQARAKELYKNGPVDFDERGVITGNDKTLNSSDDEAFSGEDDENNADERKPRLVNKSDKA